MKAEYKMFFGNFWKKMVYYIVTTKFIWLKTEFIKFWEEKFTQKMFPQTNGFEWCSSFYSFLARLIVTTPRLWWVENSSFVCWL